MKLILLVRDSGCYLFLDVFFLCGIVVKYVVCEYNFEEILEKFKMKDIF